MVALQRGDIEADDDDEYFDMASLWRLAVWGGFAGLALVVAAFAAYSDPGAGRLRLTFSAAPAPAAPAAADLAQQRNQTESETRRLAESVRTLTADRDRLLERLDAVERNLSDMTGAIDPHPPLQAATPAPMPGPPGAAPSAMPPAPPPLAWPSVAGAVQTANRMVISSALLRDTVPAELGGPQREYAVDIGGATSMSALRALWENARSRNPALFDNMRPVAAVRDGANPGTVELRLIVGPLPDVGAAVRLCAALGSAGPICQPAIFDGQRLAAR